GGARRSAARALHRPAGGGGMGPGRRPRAGPSRLFCRPRRELSRRRHGGGLPPPARARAAGPPPPGAAPRRRRAAGRPPAWGGAWGGGGGRVRVVGGGGEVAGLDRRAVGFALFTAITICAYSLVDGIGARLAGSAHAYSAALFVGIGPVMLAYALARRGGGVMPAMRRHWGTGLAGGALQLGSHGIAIWGMTVAPLALVAAPRRNRGAFRPAVALGRA